MSDPKTSQLNAMNPQASCRLFTTPQEMRNRIYDVVFTEAAGDEMIDLHLATSPLTSSLLTCKAAHAEAHAVYKRMYGEYWTRTHFHIPPVPNSAALFQAIWGIQRIRLQNVSKINNLTADMYTREPTDEKLKRNLTLERCRHSNGQPMWQLELITKETARLLSQVEKDIRWHFRTHFRRAATLAYNELHERIDSSFVLQRQLVLALDKYFLWKA